MFLKVCGVVRSFWVFCLVVLHIFGCFVLPCFGLPSLSNLNGLAKATPKRPRNQSNEHSEDPDGRRGLEIPTGRLSRKKTNEKSHSQRKAGSNCKAVWGKKKNSPKQRQKPQGPPGGTARCGPKLLENAPVSNGKTRENTGRNQ